MSKLQWRQPTRPAHVLPFINVPPDQTCILCAPPDQYAYLLLHCYNHGSVPCNGEDVCKLCDQGDTKRPVGYAPALYLPRGQGSYVRGILCVGSSFGELAERDFRGFRVILRRRQRSDKSVTKIQVLERTPIAPELLRTLNAEWFDVRPRLEFRYGVETVQTPIETLQPMFGDSQGRDDDSQGNILRFPSPPAA